MAYEYDYRPNRHTRPVSVHEPEKDVKVTTDKPEVTNPSFETCSENVDGDVEASEQPSEGGMNEPIKSDSEGTPTEVDGVKVYELETRPGGCDIRRPVPKPNLQDDDVEYANVSTNKLNQLDVPSAPIPGEDESYGMSEGGLFTLIGWGFCAIVVLWMLSIASPFLANALTQHGWRLWASLFIGCAPVLFVLGLLVCAALRFRKVPRVEQLDAASFTNKAELQRRLVAQYLDKFPVPEQYVANNDFTCGGGNRTGEEVIRCLWRLKSEMPDSRGWLVEFDRLQRMQDERAKEIIGKTWKLVAIKTAASPWKIVDMIAVIYNSTVMITKLAKLYNRRTSSQTAFRLVCRWIINIYIAGEMGEVAQGATEWASANDLISATYKPLAGFIGKVAEGGANAFLVYRLGCRAMTYFRPLV